MARRHSGMIVAVMLGVTIAPAQPAHGQLIRGSRELAELIMKKGGGRVAGESLETVTKQFSRAAARHGDEALPAIRRAGPRVIRYADDAGEHGPAVMHLFNRYGDEAAVVARNPEAIALAARYGDEAAGVMIRTRGVAVPLISRHGENAVRALKGLDARSARRLAMLEQSGDLAALGRSDELLGLVGKYGQPAMTFIWENKGALAVGTTLAAFLADPEPFINGTASLAGSVAESAAEHIAEPLITAAVPAVRETVNTGLRLITVLMVLAALGLAALIVSGMWKPALQLLGLAVLPVPSPDRAKPEQERRQN